jgi:hypothetical protein
MCVGICGKSYHGSCEGLPRGWHDSKTTVNVLRQVYICTKCRESSDIVEQLEELWTKKFNDLKDLVTSNHKSIQKTIATTSNNYSALADNIDRTATLLDGLRVEISLKNKNNLNMTFSEELQIASISKIVKQVIEDH